MYQTENHKRYASLLTHKYGITYNLTPNDMKTKVKLITYEEHASLDECTKLLLDPYIAAGPPPAVCLLKS